MEEIIKKKFFFASEQGSEQEMMSQDERILHISYGEDYQWWTVVLGLMIMDVNGVKWTVEDATSLVMTLYTKWSTSLPEHDSKLSKLRLKRNTSSQTRSEWVNTTDQNNVNQLHVMTESFPLSL